MLRKPIVGAALLAAMLLVPHAIDASTSVRLARADFDAADVGRIESDVFEMALNAASCAVRSGSRQRAKDADRDRLLEALIGAAAVGVRSQVQGTGL